MIMQKAKITNKRQITIPIRVMEKLGVNPGDSISFTEVGDHLEVKPITKKLSALELPKLFGKLSKIKLSQDELNQARKDAWEHNHKKLTDT